MERVPWACMSSIVWFWYGLLVSDYFSSKFHATTPLGVAVVGSEAYVNTILQQFVRVLLNKSLKQDFFRFFLVPLGKPLCTVNFLCWRSEEHWNVFSLFLWDSWTMCLNVSALAKKCRWVLIVCCCINCSPQTTTSVCTFGVYLLPICVQGTVVRCSIKNSTAQQFSFCR